MTSYGGEDANTCQDGLQNVPENVWSFLGEILNKVRADYVVGDGQVTVYSQPTIVQLYINGDWPKQAAGKADGHSGALATSPAPRSKTSTVVNGVILRAGKGEEERATGGLTKRPQVAPQERDQHQRQSSDSTQGRSLSSCPSNDQASGDISATEPRSRHKDAQPLDRDDGGEPTESSSGHSPRAPVEFGTAPSPPNHLRLSTAHNDDDPMEHTGDKTLGLSPNGGDTTLFESIATPVQQHRSGNRSSTGSKRSLVHCQGEENKYDKFGDTILDAETADHELPPEQKESSRKKRKVSSEDDATEATDWPEADEEGEDKEKKGQ